MKVVTIVLVPINVLYVSHIILNHIVFSYNWNLFVFFMHISYVELSCLI